jgi:hypothetical protein
MRRVVLATRLLLATALTLGWTAPGRAAPRTFTDVSGRTIVAEIMDATDTTVRVRRDDGRVFAIELATLSDTDRTHIEAWRKQQAFAFGGVVVTAHRARIASEVTQTKSSTRKTEDWCYKIAIANQSRADLAGLIIEYRVFYIDDNATATDKDELPLERRHGRATIVSLAAGSSTELQTAIVTLQSIRPKPGQRSRGTKRRKVEDSLAGIWVRVLQGDQLLQEFTAPSTLSKTASW